MNTTHTLNPTQTTFGGNDRGIACGIFIPPSRQNFVYVKGRMELVLGDLFHKWFYDALQSKAILTARPEHVPGEGPRSPITVVWQTNECCMLFLVQDWRAGFAVIKERLAALHLLEFCRISYRDNSEEIWRPLHPQDAAAFDPGELVRRWKAKLPPPSDSPESHKSHEC
jgi:hypothetical protein